MKTLILFSMMLISSKLMAQNGNIDELISKINDKQITVVMQHWWYPKMTSEAGNKIVKMGKTVTPKIASLLNDPEKGIIAHFILSEIWKKESNKINFGSKVIDEKKICLFYNDLNMYLNNDNSLFACKTDLNINKTKWEKFIAQQGSW